MATVKYNPETDLKEGYAAIGGFYAWIHFTDKEGIERLFVACKQHSTSKQYMFSFTNFNNPPYIGSLRDVKGIMKDIVKNCAIIIKHTREV